MIKKITLQSFASSKKAGIQIKPFSNLKRTELFQLLQLRQEVFVVEQNCPYLDADRYDPSCIHAMLWIDDKLIGCARIVPPGIKGVVPSIGRVVVNKKFRGFGLGEKLMKKCINHTLLTFNPTSIVISAQAHLLSFYSNLNFIAEGKGYLEDGIPHVRMRLRTKK